MQDISPKVEDAKLTLVAADGMDDWYCIERAEHEHKGGLEQTSYGFAFRWSGRISDADVEGSREEMLAIAQGIRERTYTRFTRCAVEFGEGPDGPGARFYSPRNSTDMTKGAVPLARADELAAEIEEKLKAKA